MKKSVSLLVIVCVFALAIMLLTACNETNNQTEESSQTIPTLDTSVDATQTVATETATSVVTDTFVETDDAVVTDSSDTLTETHASEDITEGITVAQTEEEVVAEIQANTVPEYKSFTLSMDASTFLTKLDQYGIRHVVGNSWAFINDNGIVVGFHLVRNDGEDIRTLQEIYVFSKDFSSVTENDLQKIEIGMSILEVVNIIGVSEGTFMSANSYNYIINGNVYIIGIKTADGSVVALPTLEQ